MLGGRQTGRFGVVCNLKSSLAGVVAQGRCVCIGILHWSLCRNPAPWDGMYRQTRPDSEESNRSLCVSCLRDHGVELGPVSGLLSYISTASACRHFYHIFFSIIALNGLVFPGFDIPLKKESLAYCQRYSNAGLASSLRT